jgi:hypothetical protein
MSGPTNWRECAEAGMSLSEAARHLGKPVSSGWAYARRHGFAFVQNQEKNRERHRERMRRLHADPARNPLVLLTPAEREDYDVCMRAGRTRAEALRAIGREDLLAPGGGADD